MDIKELIKQAKETNNKSYSPYSDFRVSAALLTADNKVYTGCNIENASYSMTICAERVAMFKAVSEGNLKWTHIVIMGGKAGKIDKVCPPCGACLQVMAEFCEADFKIILAIDEDNYEEYELKDLLPKVFCI